MFLAHPKIGNHPAAELVVKRLLPTAREHEEDFGLLEREAELHRAVHHENVVAVYGAGMVGNEPFLAMEYVEGVDLFRLIRHAEAEQSRLSPGLAVYIVRRVAAALSAVFMPSISARARGMKRSRDRRPPNIQRTRAIR